jgi:hypothetical protein
MARGSHEYSGFIRLSQIPPTLHASVWRRSPPSITAIRSSSKPSLGGSRCRARTIRFRVAFSPGMLVEPEAGLTER